VHAGKTARTSGLSTSNTMKFSYINDAKIHQLTVVLYEKNCNIKLL